MKFFEHTIKREDVIRTLKIWAAPFIVMSTCCVVLASLATYLVLFTLLKIPELTYDSLFNTVTYVYLFMLSGTFYIGAGALKFSYIFSFSVKRAISFEAAMLSLGFVQRNDQVAFARHMNLIPYIAPQPLGGEYTEDQKGRAYARFITRLHDPKRTKNLIEENRLFFDTQDFYRASKLFQSCIDKVSGETIIALRKQISLLEGETQVLREKKLLLQSSNIDLQNRLKASQGTRAAMKKSQDNAYVAKQIGKIVATELQTRFGEQKFTKDSIYDFLDKSFVLSSECRALVEEHNTSFSKVRTKVMEATRTFLPDAMICKRGEAKPIISE